MNKLVHILLILLISGWCKAQVLSGTVFSAEDKQTLPGASVYFPDLKTGAITDQNGHYEIKNLPRSKFVVQVKSIGYATQTATIDLSVFSKKDFFLKVAAIESPEVVVTGSAFSSEKSRSSVPVEQINRISITTTGANNLVQAIITTPGVDAISTGDAISKPVIRGLGFNRIVLVNEGVRQEGQQWGDEHGIEIDEFSADRIEVLKGPSSLLYGSDALGGVINILEPLSPAAGKIQGELHSDYSTNNRLTANSLMVEGNQNGFVWRARGTYKHAISYRSPEERVYNSGFDEKNADALAGINRSWGYSHFHFSQWESNIGIVEGERDSLTGKLLNNKGEVATDQQAAASSIDVPYQHVSHSKFSLVNNLIIGKSQLRVNAGWQQNERKEFEEDPTPDLWFHLSTATFDVKYYFPQKDSLKGVEAVIGASGMSQSNENKGRVFLIPAYQLFDAGGFASIKKSFRKTTLNAGLRYDIRNVSGDALTVDSNKVFSDFTTVFSSLSGSAGMTYSFSERWNLKANIGRGFRAPNIAELSSNGVHEGTFRYEVGDIRLKPETSLQFDLGITMDGKNTSVTIDGFYNLIDHFIYYRHQEGDSLRSGNDLYPAYRVTQGNSVLQGFEISFDIHPVSNFHFENSISFVSGKNKDLGKPLPYIPPLKFENELLYTFKSGKNSRLVEPYLKLGVVNALSQDRIDAFETSTPGYMTFNAGAGTTLRVANQKWLFFITANNLTNVRYLNHLSRLKEKGISEMGRNITFGINLPFGLK